MLKKFLQVAALGSAVALGCGITGTAQAIPLSSISQVYFFGDSLTDSGFNDLWHIPTPLPVGKAPTFTTFGGHTWAQYVAHDVKGFVLPVYPGPNPGDTITNNAIYADGFIPYPPASPGPLFVSGTLRGIDYACGGSTTGGLGNGETWAPALSSQVGYYLSTHNGAADPNAVYFIWEGANDLLILLASNPSQLQLLVASNAAAVNIATEVSNLAAKGAKRIVVLSLPNIGLTPLIGGLSLTTSNPALPGTFKSVTYTFNSMLNSALGRVLKNYIDLKVMYFDVYDLLDNVILATQAGQPYTVAGQSFKFVNYTTPACATASSSIYCPSSAPSGYIFADTIHPTDAAHRILSLSMEIALQEWQ